MLDKNILLTIVLAPLLGALVAGLFGKRIGRVASHSVTIAGVALSCVLSCQVLYQLVWGGAETFNQNIYTWFEVGGTSAHVGFLIDRLTAMMMVVVTFVSLMV
ncbi:MAG TPA: NADH-quinone oxidoreductase subunit L, partial [Dokdonella sp.]|nr:NADH-quinone oxidoreductase subunit L [Dokdonella sp.]